MMNSTISIPMRAQDGARVEKGIRYWKFLDDAISGRIFKVLVPVTLLNIAVGLYMALFYAPTEKTMGTVQRIFYFHVPSAWIGFGVFIAGTVIAMWPDPREARQLARLQAQEVVAAAQA